PGEALQLHRHHAARTRDELTPERRQHESCTARARIERAVAARVGAEGAEELQTLADRDVLGTEAAALAILRDGRGAGHRDCDRPAELLIVAVARVGPCMADAEHVAAACNHRALDAVEARARNAATREHRRGGKGLALRVE